jgi:hypothetical protein
MPDDFDMPWYQLTIVNKSGNTHCVYGPKQQLWPFYRAWVERDWHDGKPLCVEGFMDSCDRAPLFVAVDPEFIGAVHLHLYS